MAFIANSDFHKPKHIYSWKTVLHCEKDSEAIKDCIRTNEHIAITLYRDGLCGAALRAPQRKPEVLHHPEELVEIPLMAAKVS